MGVAVSVQQLLNEHSLTVTLNDMSTGIYFIHVTGDDYDLRKQIVVDEVK